MEITDPYSSYPCSSRNNNPQPTASSNRSLQSSSYPRPLTTIATSSSSQPHRSGTHHSGSFPQAYDPIAFERLIGLSSDPVGGSSSGASGIGTGGGASNFPINQQPSTYPRPQAKPTSRSINQGLQHQQQPQQQQVSSLSNLNVGRLASQITARQSQSPSPLPINRSIPQNNHANTNINGARELSSSTQPLTVTQPNTTPTTPATAPGRTGGALRPWEGPSPGVSSSAVGDSWESRAAPNTAVTATMGPYASIDHPLNGNGNTGESQRGMLTTGKGGSAGMGRQVPRGDSNRSGSMPSPQMQSQAQSETQSILSSSTPIPTRGRSSGVATRARGRGIAPGRGGSGGGVIAPTANRAQEVPPDPVPASVTTRGRGGSAFYGRGVGLRGRGRGGGTGSGMRSPAVVKPVLRTLFQHAQSYAEKAKETSTTTTVTMTASGSTVAAISNGEDGSRTGAGVGEPNRPTEEDDFDDPDSLDVEVLIRRQQQLVEKTRQEEIRKAREERERILEEQRRRARLAEMNDDGGFDLPGGDDDGDVVESEIDFSDSDFDVEFESDDSDYERSRLRRIEQNKQMMAELGLGTADTYKFPDGLVVKRRHRARRAAGEDRPSRRRARKRYLPAVYEADETTFDYCDVGERQRAAYVEIKPVFRSERIAKTYTYMELPPVPENPREPDPSEDEDLPVNDDWWWIEPVAEEKPKKQRKPQVFRERPSDAPGDMCHQCRRRSYKPKMVCTNKDPECTRRYCLSCVEVRYKFPFDDMLPNWICPRCVGNCNCSACLRATGLIELLKTQIPTAEGKRMNFKDVAKTTNVQQYLEDLGAPKVQPMEQERITAIRFIHQAEDIISPDIPDDVYDELMYPGRNKVVPGAPREKKKRVRQKKSKAPADALLDPDLDGTAPQAPTRKRKRAPQEFDENGELIKKKRVRKSRAKKQVEQYEENFDEFGEPMEVDELDEGYGEEWEGEEEYGEEQLDEGDEFERTYGYEKPTEPEVNSSGYVFGGSYDQAAGMQVQPPAPEVFQHFTLPPAPAPAPQPERPKPRKRLTKKQKEQAEAAAEAEAEAAAAIAAAEAAAQLQMLAAQDDTDLSSPQDEVEEEEEEESEEESDDEPAARLLEQFRHGARHPPNVFADQRQIQHGRYAPITVEESVRYAQQKRLEADAILARHGAGIMGRGIAGIERAFA